MDRDQFRDEIVAPVLQRMDLWSPAAEALLIGTALHESGGLRYVRQLGGGPALGLYQMEPATHRDIWENFLRFRPRYADAARAWIPAVPGIPAAENLVWNLAYATAMARLHYRRVPEPLPDADDVVALGAYWKAHYNTRLGAGSVEAFVTAYHRHHP